MSEEIKPAFYAIIPADVRYDCSLKPNAKLLYGEITALCNEKGYCWAGNEYFAKLYGVNLKTISSWISQLVSKKYLDREMVYKPDTKEIDSRILKLPMLYPLSIKNGIPSPRNNGEGETPQNEDVTEQKSKSTPSTKKRIPLHQKAEENITIDYIHEVFNRDNSLKNYQNFIPLVLRWVTYKKEEKKQRYKTEDSLKSWIKSLIKYSAGNFKIAEEIIETAMANLWMGIRPLNNYKKQSQKPATINFTPQNNSENKYGGL